MEIVFFLLIELNRDLSGKGTQGKHPLNLIAHSRLSLPSNQGAQFHEQTFSSIFLLKNYLYARFLC